jgi:hypothetical protein
MRLRPESLTFVGYRTSGTERIYCVVLECVPEHDRLTLLPLARGRDVAVGPRRAERRAELTEA